jgi:hypothetical protein
MYDLKKIGKALTGKLLGPGPRLIKKEFTGPRSHTQRLRNTALYEDQYTFW